MFPHLSLGGFLAQSGALVDLTDSKSSSFSLGSSKTGFFPSLWDFISSWHRCILIQHRDCKKAFHFPIYKINLVEKLYCNLRIHFQAVFLWSLKDVVAMLTEKERERQTERGRGAVKKRQEENHLFLGRGFISQGHLTLANTAQGRISISTSHSEAALLPVVTAMTCKDPCCGQQEA